VSDKEHRERSAERSESAQRAIRHSEPIERSEMELTGWPSDSRERGDERSEAAL
jgi:hypothetical protein